MKIFHLGSACGHEQFTYIVENSRKAPSQSAQNFESAFLNGLSQVERANFDAHSFYSIAPFPKGCFLRIKEHKESIEGCDIHIMPMLNLPFIKQWCMSTVTKARLVSWLKANRDDGDKCVLLYSLYPATAKNVLKVCRKYNCKVFVFITDAPKTMYTYQTQKNPIMNVLANVYRNKALQLQSQFDGYVFITDAMSAEIAPDKPYVLLEVICDEHIFDGINCEKSNPKAIMYAGVLHKLFGIGHIIDAFEKIKGDYELWLFGDGDMVDEIKERSKADPRIKYMGRRDRRTVLEYEKRATLLLNVRDITDEYTKFSFPSKMIEYMLSGTPMLTTRLPGIPEEYFPYVFTAESTDSQYLAELITDILSDDEKLQSVGSSAKQFAMDYKNARSGAEKVFGFLCKQVEEHADEDKK